MSREDKDSPEPKLTATPAGLGLTAPHCGKPLLVDFSAGPLTWRRTKGGAGELLARALGLKRRQGKVAKILDGTAGLGRDSFIMASLGCQVDMLERNPVVFALLADGLARGEKDPNIAAIIRRMHLLETTLAELPRPAPYDIIYLDPMFPHRTKSALVKKEMRLLRQLVGDDGDSDALLAAACELGASRVVVKRPKGAPWLAGLKPHHEIRGKKGRFDIYLPPYPAL
ncbi:MAG: class I SAM-dependent methyltransferase [Thermodesulfobacteriota bacterium]